MKDQDDDASGFALTVGVQTPERAPAQGSPRSSCGRPEGRKAEPPLRSERTNDDAASRFAGLAAGNYLVAAGREDFLDATVNVEEFDPKKERRSVIVVLREGGRLHAHALDEKDKAVRDVELSFTRITPLPEMAITDKAVVGRKQSRRVAHATRPVTAEIRGLYTGDYHLEARMTGEQSTTRFVYFRDGRNERGKPRPKRSSSRASARTSSFSCFPRRDSTEF
jgi:hypothetical protein